MAEQHPMMDVIENGYGVWRQALDPKILYDLTYYKSDYDHPNRGHDRNEKYYDRYQESVEWANYWTDPLNDHPRIADVRRVTDRLAGRFLIMPVFYHADCSVLTPLNSMIRPHVDTPHRHDPWNKFVDYPLGIQIGIPLHQTSGLAGTTAFLPRSHKRVWDIKSCYRGEYTEEFLKGCEQPEVNYGDVIVWDARILHSQMPNVTDTNRYMLLLNYLEERVVDRVMQYEASLIA